MTFSPVTVLMSWCRLKTLTPVISWTIASRNGRRRFDQMRADFLEQVPPLLGRERLDQMLLGGSQNALKADHEEIPEQVGMDVLGAPAHVILLEATHPFTNSGFDLSLGPHGDFSRGSHGNRFYPIGGVLVNGYCVPRSELYNGQQLSDD